MCSDFKQCNYNRVAVKEKCEEKKKTNYLIHISLPLVGRRAVTPVHEKFRKGLSINI